MGKFLQPSVKLDQITKDNCPEGIEYKDGLFITLNHLTYISNNNQVISIPLGYITDGYSKPKLTQWLVGGRFEDDCRPAVLHDYLCQNHGYYIAETFKPLMFKQANDLFYEAMRSIGIGFWKAKIYRFAVNFNLKRW